MAKILISLILLLHICRNQCQSQRQTEEFQGKKFILGYEVDHKEKTITFDIRVQTKGWVGLGINLSKGRMFGGDFFIGGVYENGSSYFGDYYLDGNTNTRPKQDKINNWNLLEAQENGLETFMKFSRKFDTCDRDHDVLIDNGTISILWSYGQNDGLDYHQGNRGSSQFNLLDPPLVQMDTTKFSNWSVRVNNPMPEKDTTYFCTLHKSPRFEGKNHIIGFETYLPSELALKHTHHFVVTRCIGENISEIIEPILKTSNGWDCEKDHAGENFAKVRNLCKIQHIWAWAVGGKPFFLPDTMGYPVGEETQHEYLMLELHYDNFEKLAGIQFETGFDIYYTDKIRPIEASMLFVALDILPTHFIPPGSQNFTLVGHCDPNCTNKLPQTGIKMFNVGLHSHIAGRKLKLRHFRGSEELPWISYDDNYDFDYQQSRQLHQDVDFFPGDQMTIECTYDTTDRSETTMFGLGTRNEMCMVYLWYWPRLTESNEIAMCSSRPKENIWEKFGVEFSNASFSLDPIIVKPESFANYTFSQYLSEQVNWTLDLRQEIQEIFRFGNHTAVCLAGPGRYETNTVKYPDVIKPFEIPRINCAQKNNSEIESGTEEKEKVVNFIEEIYNYFLFYFYGFLKWIRASNEH